MVAANEAGVIPLPPNAGAPIPLPPPPPPGASASAGTWRAQNTASKPDAVTAGESTRHGRVDVDGLSVPSVIATAFNDPRKDKKPFTYFQGGKAPDLSDSRPSVLRKSHHTTTTTFGIPKVLPLFSDTEEDSTAMPVSHLQYNSPLPLYSKESAQESLHQQVGPGAQAGFGGSKTFDPARSKTLQLLKEQEEEARQRPTTPHSVQYDEPSRDEVTPHYHGYVNPHQQSPMFKRLQFVTNGTDESDHQTGGSQHPTDSNEMSYSSHQQSHTPTQHVPMVALHDPLVEGDRDHPLDPNFSQKIAAAERPNVPAKQEPSWTHAARNKQQKWDRSGNDPAEERRTDYREPDPDWARSSQHRRVEITRPFSVPPQPAQPYYQQPPQQQYQQPPQQQYQQPPQQQYQQPPQQQYQPQYQQQHNDDHQYYYDRQNEQQYQERLKEQERDQHKFRSYSPGRAPSRGYEMGGTDFNPPQRSPGGNYYYSTLPAHYPRRAQTPEAHRGYEFGGTDFGYGGQRHQYYGGGNYHGYGPESPRRRAKSQEPGPRPGQEHWLRVAVAPNVDEIHSRGLVGDTLSNMHLGREKTPTREQRESFGTFFGPTEGFKAGHRHHELHRSSTLTEPPTFSVSAPRMPGQRSYRETQQAQSYSRSQNNAQQQSSQSSFRDKNGTDYRTMIAAPLGHASSYQSVVPQKQVNISSLVSGVAEKPGPQPEVIPHWKQSAEQKHVVWDTRQVDPAATRSKDHSDPMPTWAQTAQRKRADWEVKASATEARTQLPASYKVPPEPSPHWARNAEQKHSLWQSEFDRHGTTGSTGGAGQDYGYNQSGGFGGGTGLDRSQNQSSAFQSSGANRSSQFSSSANYQTKHESTTTRSSSQPSFTSPVRAPAIALPAPSAAMNQSYSSSSSYSKNTTSAAPAPVIALPAPAAASSALNQSYSASSSSYSKKTTSAAPAPVIALPAPSAALNQSYSSSSNYSKTTTSAAPKPVSRPAYTPSATFGQDSQSRSVSQWQESKPWSTGGANTKAHTTGSYVDPSGHHVSYKKEMVTSSDPGKEYSMLTEEERKVMEEPLQPGVISRHVTTKYYKKSTFSDSKTTTTATNQPLPPYDPNRRADTHPKPGQIQPGVTQF